MGEMYCACKGMLEIVKSLTLSYRDAMLKHIGLWLGICALMSSACGQDYAGMRAQVKALAELTAPPQTYPADSFETDGVVEPIYYDGLAYEGKKTRVFAWVGVPEAASEQKPVPGVVLVHGGGGTAFLDWVKLWNARGYAAISIAVEGQTSVRPTEKKAGQHWQYHQWAGPHRHGIYGDSDKPLTDQWMYHAVADTILANSLLRANPRIDADKVGLMGISWGGIITSTVIGIDQRFAFGIPTYGCGHLADAPNQYGKALGENQVYRQVWDPALRLERASMPTLWYSWTGDTHFPMDCFAASYGQVSGAHMVALRPNMRHGHSPGWKPGDSYAFADSVTQESQPWCVQTKSDANSVEFACTKSIDKATLTTTTDTGHSSERKWVTVGVPFSQEKDRLVIENLNIAQDTTAWFVNMMTDGLVASSDYFEPTLSK